MIGKRQHSSPIPENLACEISDATSQVRVSGNRRRGRLYNQPARHCPFFSLSHTLTLTHAHHRSFPLTLASRDRSALFLSQEDLMQIHGCPGQCVANYHPEISRRNRVATKRRPEKLSRRVSTSRAFAEISSPARAESSWVHQDSRLENEKRKRQ